MLRMGSKIGELLSKKELNFEHLCNKTVALDAYNILYQFLSIIRQPDGTPLKDKNGNITSHLSGLFYRTINLMEKGIKPVFVFDGNPPELKLETVKKRKKTREESRKEWKKAKKEGRIKEAYKKATMSARLSSEMVEESIKLLEAMGIPSVQAPSEGEAQAAYMVKKEDAWAVGSQDYDALLFGSPRLLRNLTITGRRKLPNKEKYVKIVPELYKLEENLKNLEIDLDQLIDISILIGTDYNDGVKGIGPKTAIKVVKRGSEQEDKKRSIVKSIENEVEEPDKWLEEFEQIQKIFKNPNVSDDYVVDWESHNSSEIIGFLCNEKSFSENRVEKGINRLEKAMDDIRTQSRLDSF